MSFLLLIDGSSLLSTSFFGTLPFEYKTAKSEEDYARARKKIMQASEGVYTNGVYTMVRTLLNLIKNQKPSHIAVAWDLSRETFRRELYPQYKAQRGELNFELGMQFPMAQRVLEQMNIIQFVSSRYEADDLIGTLRSNLSNQIPVVILTKDQDALQLVNENVRHWYITNKAKEMYKEVNINPKNLNLPTGVFEFTPELVEHFYGVNPLQIIDRKAIEGDVSDNIPGVSGIGEKTSVPLLKHFYSVENIYDFIEANSQEVVTDLIKSLSIKRSPLKKLIEHKELALLSKKLATICCEVEELSTVTLESLKLNINSVGKRQAFEELDFEQLLEPDTVA
ncbi:5'-3' exonuclease [Paenibacillus sp. SYP-B3998]|uniref:5'-3' exonuclease n=1 Tax=Paenibacillus sp. SYP-B3998 TaxID=2678564 RepID=A0A6G4A3I0_9BACL|nr:5'-3' exonuclease H3TH domain-containing protein [Paenibacillus sp. SYP-B3998]NEW08207.1 5'-3' exonuclease [Paenibacillus sp. SYP-B3998]